MNNVVDTARQEGEKKGREKGREEGRLSIIGTIAHAPTSSSAYGWRTF
ncbi:MAG: hypothetical protein NT070_14035 [Cyanobacteria bacterium]|nr:hypothetical protein [Cyanobacteriota bacterium]